MYLCTNKDLIFFQLSGNMSRIRRQRLALNLNVVQGGKFTVKYTFNVSSTTCNPSEPRPGLKKKTSFEKLCFCACACDWLTKNQSEYLLKGVNLSRNVYHDYIYVYTANGALLWKEMKAQVVSCCVSEMAKQWR